MNFRNIDVKKLLNGKMATGRPVDFKIKTGKWHKAISDRKKGSFGEIFVESAEIVRLGDLSDYEIKRLGYSSLDEYLSEPFNKGMTEDSFKKIIVWSKFRPKWSVIEQILAK